MESIKMPENCWVVPKGGKTIFSAVKMRLKIENGKLCLDDAGSIDIANSKAKANGSFVQFPVLNGEENKRQGPFLYMYNPKMNLIFTFAGLTKMGVAKEFANDLNRYSQV